MTRQYKEFTPVMGVYRITHLPSGRTLLGASVYAQGMLNRIRFQLDAGLHRQQAKLQQDWSGGYPDDFHFEVLDELKPQPDKDPQADLQELLSLWQEKLALPAELLY